MPSIGAVFWNGSDEAMPILQAQPTTTGCSVPASSGVCPNLLALTVQVPFDAPINPAVGSNIVVRPSGIAVFVSGEKSFYFGAQALSDQVHILTMCDVLVAGASPAQGNNGLPCAPMITHADGTRVSLNRPAVAGEELVAYATGLGQTNPALTTGQPAVRKQPNRRDVHHGFQLSRPMHSQPSRCPALAPAPLFAGATQGFIGLYQINFIVPPPPAGLQPCVDFAVPRFKLVRHCRQSNLTVSVGSTFSFDGAGICVTPSGSLMNKRLLLIGATTGYQTRAFAEAAERLGYELVLATDRCHVLDDPWGDRAIALRFEDPRGRGRVLAAQTRVDGIVAVGDRPAYIAALAAERMGIPYNSPDSVAASRNKFLARERFRAAGLLVPEFHRDCAWPKGPGRARSRPLSLRAQAARTLRQPWRHSRQQSRRSSSPRSAASRTLLADPEIARLARRSGPLSASGILHRRPRVRARRHPHQRTASRAGAVRQARSAGWSVLRRDHLRHAVARSPRRRKTRSCEPRKRP